MKQSRIIIVIISLLFFFSLLSCKKYLEKKSSTLLVVPTTLADFQALLDESNIMNKLTPGLGSSSSDDFYQPLGSYDFLVDFEKSIYTWKPYPMRFANEWSNSYTCVYPCNLTLEALNKITLTSTNKTAWNNIRGSALFFRSHAFLNLLWIHAKAYDENTANSDLGIALRLGSDFNEPTTRATVKQCYDKVISDLKESINCLPSLAAFTVRPSKAAAYGLLARAYLSMRQYDNALKYSDSCLQIQNYLIDFNGDPAINNLNGITPFRSDYTLNKEIIFASKQASNFTIHSFGYVDTALYNSYSDDDLRKIGFFRNFGTNLKRFKGNYFPTEGTLFTGIATDEMYLTRAECNARLGNKDAALLDLNKLMKKRWKNIVTYIDITATDAVDALNKVLIERRKELLYRGLRWIDIKRLNKDGGNIILKRVLPNGIVTLQANANYYAIPIPQDIIELTGIPQNPYP